MGELTGKCSDEHRKFACANVMIVEKVKLINLYSRMALVVAHQDYPTNTIGI